jgi:hypothetical protein
MSLPLQIPYGVSRTGKPINIGDSCSITGTVIAITGYGPEAQLTILCSGATNGPTDPVTGAYSYTLSNTGAGTNVPATGVYAADVTSTQTL